MWLYVPPECLPCAPEEAVWNSESDSLYQTLEQSVLWKSKPRQASSWKRGWKTDPLIRLLCGRIYEPSMASRGVARWISSLADTRVSRSVMLASASEQQTLATCGPTSLESCETLSPSGASSRTSALICDSDSVKSPEAFTQWATALRRHCLQRKKSARLTAANGSSSWPTARAGYNENRTTQNAPSHGNGHGKTLSGEAFEVSKNWPTPDAAQGGRVQSEEARAAGKKAQIGLDNTARNWQTPNAAAEAPNLGSNIKNGPKSLLAQPALATDAAVESAGVCQTPATFQGRFRRQVNQTERTEELLPAQAESTTERVSAWPTPSANEDAAGTLNGNMQRMLSHAAQEWDTGSHQAPRTPPGGERSSQVDQTSRRRLNPAFVTWLMGWPEAWLSLAPINSTSWETGSFPNKLPRPCGC